MFLDVAPGFFGGFELLIAGIATAVTVILVLVLFFTIRYKKRNK